MLNDIRRTDATVSFRSRRYPPAPVFLLLALISACAQSPQESTDELAREEPLEIQLGGVGLAVVMRTPGNAEPCVPVLSI